MDGSDLARQVRVRRGEPLSGLAWCGEGCVRQDATTYRYVDRRGSRIRRCRVCLRAAQKAYELHRPSVDDVATDLARTLEPYLAVGLSAQDIAWIIRERLQRALRPQHRDKVGHPMTVEARDAHGSQR